MTKSRRRLPFYTGSSRWTWWCMALLISVAAPRLAGTACTGFGPDFGQFLPSCGSGYCYVVTPGYRTQQSFAGAF